MNQLSTLIRLLSLLVISIFLPDSNFAQAPTIQDCLGAIPVCQQIYSEANSTTGQGNYPNEVNPFSSCLSGEDNSVWYTFTVNQSGAFGFLLTPNNANDDYDWGLYNITNANCSEIYTNPNLLVSCNAAGGTFGTLDCDAPTGATGGTNYNIQGGGCGSVAPSVNAGFSPENALIFVLEGNTYVLMVANWTGSPFGYTIDFGISDVGIFDFEGPEIEEIVFPDECTDDEINIVFSENVRCDGVNPSDFQVDGPGGPYSISIGSDNCDIGGLYDKEFTLTTDPPISQSGSYTLSVCCVPDVCDNELAPQTFVYDITIVEEPTVDLGQDTSFCIGTVLNFDVTNDQATYQWQDGSTAPTYAISQEGDYSVTVSNVCGTTSDDISIISIEFPPMIDLGNPFEELCDGETLALDAFSEASTYIWSNGQTTPNYTVTSEGTYGVSVTNACGTSTDEIIVDYIAPIVVDLPPNLSPCSFDDVILDVTNETANYLWEDGSVSAVRSIDMDGTYSVTVSNNCEVIEATVNIEFIFPPEVDLGDDQVLCDGETVILNATFAGANYTWQDGQTNATYEVSQEGQYSVTVKNPCGSIADAVDISYVPNVSFDLGADTFFCNGPLLLDAVPYYDFAKYKWQNGLDSNRFWVEAPGTYWLRLDSGCSVETDTITFFPCEICDVYFPNAFSPNDDGFNDLFQPFTPCEMENFNMKVFDRWGGHIYDSGIGLPGMWDGTSRGEKLQPGVYLWVASFDVTLNGETFSRQMEGSVNLIK